jgi:hypothetical protein
MCFQELKQAILNFTWVVNFTTGLKNGLRKGIGEALMLGRWALSAFENNRTVTLPSFFKILLCRSSGIAGLNEVAERVGSYLEPVSGL